MKTFVILILVAFLIKVSFATSFFAVPIDKQLREADAVVRGVYLSHLYKKLPSGEVVTELTFKIREVAGIKLKPFAGREIKILQPGGVWGDINYKISGTSTFKEGEESVLLLKKGKFGYWPLNLGMAKYHIVQEGRQTFLKSAVFPNHPRLGNISYENFRYEMKKEFGTVVSYESYSRSVNKVQSEIADAEFLGNSREIASGEPHGSKAVLSRDGKPFEIFWPLLLLASMGLVMTYFARRKG